MVYDQNTVRILYKKLLNLYPRGFREWLGESMEQTFNDLYQERQIERGLFSFVFWTFAETGMGILWEHLLLMTQGDSMKTFISSPRAAAIIGLILSLPLGLTFVVFMFEMEQLAKPLTELPTTNGYGLNGPGRIFLIGGLLLLPVAFVLNLQPILKRERPEGKRRLYTINLVVGTIILLLITVTWGTLLVEQIYYLKGTRCD